MSFTLFIKVILHRTLIEIASHEERIALIEELWQRTNRFLLRGTRISFVFIVFTVLYIFQNLKLSTIS